MTDERHVLPSIDSPAINVRSSNGISSALNAQVSDDSAKGSQLKYPQSTGQERLDPEALHEKRDAPPDAGTTAWLVVLGAFCGQFVSFGWINCTFGYCFVFCLKRPRSSLFRYWSLPNVL